MHHLEERLPVAEDLLRSQVTGLRGKPEAGRDVLRGTASEALAHSSRLVTNEPWWGALTAVRDGRPKVW